MSRRTQSLSVCGGHRTTPLGLLDPKLPGETWLSFPPLPLAHRPKSSLSLVTPGGQRSKPRSRHQHGAAPTFGLVSFFCGRTATNFLFQRGLLRGGLASPILVRNLISCYHPPAGVCSNIATISPSPRNQERPPMDAVRRRRRHANSWLNVWSRGAFVSPSSMRRPARVTEERCAFGGGGRVQLSPALPPSPRVSPPPPPSGQELREHESPELQLTPTDARLLHGVDVLRLCQLRGQRLGRRPVLVHHAQLLRSVGERLPSSPPPPARSASAAGRHASASPTRAATIRMRTGSHEAYFEQTQMKRRRRMMRTSPVMMQEMMMYRFSPFHQSGSRSRYSHLAPMNPGSHLEQQGGNAVRTFLPSSHVRLPPAGRRLLLLEVATVAVDAVAGQLLGTRGEVAVPGVQVQGVFWRDEAEICRYAFQTSQL